MALVPTRFETAANWASSTVILTNGEVGIETDTGYVKTGDGVRTWAALPKTDDQETSAYRASRTSDETGTGAVVLATSPTIVTPTFTTPVLGVATATSIVASGPISGGLKGNLGAAPTVASATTIAPTTAVVLVSGTTTIETITAPAPIATLGGSITVIPTGVFLTGVTGNIALASTSVVSKALIMTYDPTTTKWYPSY